VTEPTPDKVSCLNIRWQPDCKFDVLWTL